LDGRSFKRTTLDAEGFGRLGKSGQGLVDQTVVSVVGGMDEDVIVRKEIMKENCHMPSQ